MICGIFHSGSGIGNQLHRYVASRVFAMDKGYDWGMVNPHLFKGYSFLNLGMGHEVIPTDIKQAYTELRINDKEGVDIRGYDFVGIDGIQDDTLVDGEFQGEKYYEHHKSLIDRWLNVEPLDLSDDLCVIAFRGGEYVGFSDLFLTKDYWNKAIAQMLRVNPEMKFHVVTDDVESAKEFFPNFSISHEIGRDWRSIRYANYLILSNSSFGILPAWLGEAKRIIAPWGWARHNKGFWALEQNKMKGWHYQKLDGTYEIYFD